MTNQAGPARSKADKTDCRSVQLATRSHDRAKSAHSRPRPLRSARRRTRCCRATRRSEDRSPVAETRQPRRRHCSWRVLLPSRVGTRRSGFRRRQAPSARPASTGRRQSPPRRRTQETPRSALLRARLRRRRPEGAPGPLQPRHGRAVSPVHFPRCQPCDGPSLLAPSDFSVSRRAGLPICDRPFIGLDRSPSARSLSSTSECPRREGRPRRSSVSCSHSLARARQSWPRTARSRTTRLRPTPDRSRAG